MAVMKAKTTMMAKGPGYKKANTPAKPEKVTRESALNATYTGMASMPKSAVKPGPKRPAPQMGVGTGKGRGAAMSSAKSRMKR